MLIYLNNLRDVKSEKSKDVLARNLKSIAVKVLGEANANANALAQAKRLKQRTLHNAMEGVTDPYKVLDTLSDKLGHEPWQLLYPADDPFVLTILRVYSACNESGRELIRIATIGAESTLSKPQPAKKSLPKE